MEVEGKKQGMKKGWKRRWGSYSDNRDGRSSQAKSEIACHLNRRQTEQNLQFMNTEFLVYDLFWLPRP
jgi:hypothetical protein